ncbi:integral membrane protein [Actinobacillus pleuropneumoniae]|nr:integral membrane protein [Actinobacillus pleuropneumoniae]
MSNEWLYWGIDFRLICPLYPQSLPKFGLQGIDSDFATFIRTIVIIIALIAFPHLQ